MLVSLLTLCVLLDLMKNIPGGASERSGVRTTAFKSRLCTRFMQKGECSYGPTCHFAHGHDDLQNMDRASTGPAVSCLTLLKTNSLQRELMQAAASL